jgi:hypothetical protein
MKNLLLTICILFQSLITIPALAQDRQIYILNNSEVQESQFVVTEEENQILIDLTLGSFTSITEEGQSDSRILLTEGINVIEKGQPDIQHLAVSIAIPSMGKTNAVITSTEYTDYQLFSVKASKGDPGIYNDNDNTPAYDQSIYQNNAFWPSQNVVASDPYIWAGIRGQSLHFYPVQYNPVTKTLRVHNKISVKLELTSEKGINELSYDFIPNKLQPLAESHFRNQVNSSYFATSHSDRYMAPVEAGNMLVIAHPDFIKELQPFIEWKNQKGIPTELVDVTTITNGTANDAQTIKDFVRDYYLTNGLTYLVLAGDAAFVPTCHAEKGASDNMYGYILGDDSYPEVLVGRFPCSNDSECKVMVEKTVQYERNPVVSDAYSRFVGIASGLGPGDDGEMDYEHIRNLTEDLTNAVYKSVSELYDGNREGNDLSGNPTAQMVSGEFASGAGAIMYIGHGSSGSWVTSGFSSADAKNLTNTIHPFIWSAGCNNGDFEYTNCLAEALLKSESDGKPTGAIATLMSSASQTWYPPMEAQDEIALVLGGQRDPNQVNTFGGVSMSGCMQMNDQYGLAGARNTDIWVLFGDPSLELRTALPGTLAPVHSENTGSDATSFTITNIVPGTTICASSKGKIIASVVSEESAAVIELSGLDQITGFTLTLTAKNRIPYIAEVKVTDMPARAINPVPGSNTYKISKNTDFTWSLSDGCTPHEYTFLIRQKGTEQWQDQSVTSAEEIEVTNLQYNTAYEWKLISKNEKGTAESEVFNFTTIDAPDEDFEQNSFPRNAWENLNNWYVDDSEAFEGTYSIHSGNTTANSTSSLIYSCETLSCDYISFAFKTNIRSTGSKLEFFIDDFMVAEWDYTNNWNTFIYQVETGLHQLEWRFTSTDTTDSESAAWLDNIYLPVNAPLEISSLEQAVCPANFVMVDTEITNYSSILWETTGTGSFDDITRSNPVYFPSTEDLLNETIIFRANIIANETCGIEVYDYVIKVAALPEIPEINDTTLYLGESISLSKLKNDTKQFLICGTTTFELPLVIDQSILKPGPNTLTIIMENEKGCSSTEEFTVNLIDHERPGKSELMVYPNPASEKLNVLIPEASNNPMISIFSLEGQLVESSQFDQTNSSSIEISNLKPGLYIIRAEYDGTVSTGRFVKI